MVIFIILYYMTEWIIMTEPEYIKPSEYARRMSIEYHTVIRKYHRGEISGVQDPSGTIRVENPFYGPQSSGKTGGVRVVLYARVSSSTNKPSLDGQIDRLRSYAAARGYTIVGEEREIASGLNDQRRRLCRILKGDDWDVLLVEHKDRLTRFGWGYIETLLAKTEQRAESVNMTDDKNREIVDDLISIITSFCGKIYGANRKAKTMRIIHNLEDDKNEE
jgi:predicted site-specific integrase-resolvase